MIELVRKVKPLPCPFCGGDGVVRKNLNYTEATYYRIECSGCFVQTDWTMSPVDAVDGWNRRVK